MATVGQQASTQICNYDNSPLLAQRRIFYIRSDQNL